MLIFTSYLLGLGKACWKRGLRSLESAVNCGNRLLLIVLLYVTSTTGGTELSTEYILVLMRRRDQPSCLCSCLRDETVLSCTKMTSALTLVERLENDNLSMAPKTSRGEAFTYVCTCISPQSL